MTAAIDYPIPEIKGLAPPPSRQVRPWAWAVLALIVIVGAGLRFGRIGRPVYELDEYWHAELSTGRGSEHNHLPLNEIFTPGPKLTGLSGAPPWWRAWTHMDDTIHPPLYPIALRLWRTAFGEDNAGSRSLGAMASLISVLMLFDLARRLHGTSAGLWAAAIFAVASPQIALARTLRGYSFGLMLILCAALLVVMIQQDKGRAAHWKLVALFLASLAALLTYYFSALSMGAIGLYALTKLRGRARVAVVAALILSVIVFVAVWWPGLWMQFHNPPSRQDSWIHDAGAGHVKRVFSWAASIPARMLFEPRQAFVKISLLGASIYIIPTLLLRRRPDLLLWVLWLWAVMLPLLALDLWHDSKHLSFVRYVLATGPAVYALLAAVLQHLPRVSMRHVLPLAAVLGCLMSIENAYEEPRQDYDLLGIFIDEHRKGNEVVIIHTQNKSWFANAMFLVASHDSRTYPWPTLIVDHFPLDPVALGAVRAAGGACVIVEGSGPSPSELVPDSVLRDWTFVPGVCVVSHVETSPRTGPTSVPGNPPTTAP